MARKQMWATVRMGTAVALMGGLFAVPARADDGPTVAAAVPEELPKAVPAPPQYAAPWGLPSVFSGTGARLDNSFALSTDTRGIDAPMARASYNVIGVDLPVAF